MRALMKHMPTGGQWAVSQTSNRAGKQVAKTRTRRILREDRPESLKDNSDTRMKLQIVLPDGSRLGPGKIALLELIKEEGSLSRAAKRMKISYRHAWLYMRQINEAFSEAAVATPENGHGGGPAQLTRFGQSLILQYRALEKEVRNAGACHLEWLDKHKSPTPSGG